MYGGSAVAVLVIIAAIFADKFLHTAKVPVSINVEEIRKVLFKKEETLDRFLDSIVSKNSERNIKDFVRFQYPEFRDDIAQKGFAIFIYENDTLTSQVNKELLHRIRTSEQRYKQAQSISHIGNWTWDIATNKVAWTDELYRIFEVEDLNETITYNKYLSFIHPEDMNMLVGFLQNAYETHKPFDFIHRTPEDMAPYLSTSKTKPPSK